MKLFKFPFSIKFKKLFSTTTQIKIQSDSIGGSVTSPYGSRKPFVKRDGESKLITRLVNMRVVKNMTKNGKIARFSAIVVAGTGNGGLGCGHAKHDSGSESVTKAGKLAVRDIQYFNRWQDRTLFHDDYSKYKATKLYVRPAPPSKNKILLNSFLIILDFGRRCHPTIAEMCRCLGIKDISAKVHGSSHPMNVMKAFLQILEKQKSPEQVAAETGLRVVDVLRVFETNCREKPIRGDHIRRPLRGDHIRRTSSSASAFKDKN